MMALSGCLGQLPIFSGCQTVLRSPSGWLRSGRGCVGNTHFNNVDYTLQHEQAQRMSTTSRRTPSVAPTKWARATMTRHCSQGQKAVPLQMAKRVATYSTFCSSQGVCTCSRSVPSGVAGLQRGEHELVHGVKLRAEPHSIVHKLRSKQFALKQAWERHCRLGLACACAREFEAAQLHGCSASGRKHGSRGRRLVARLHICIPNKISKILAAACGCFAAFINRNLCCEARRAPLLLPQPFEQRPVKHANANEHIYS